MARQTVKLTNTALVELGSDRLASLLIEHAATDKNLEKKLKLALAASQGSDTLMSALAKSVFRAFAKGPSSSSGTRPPLLPTNWTRSGHPSSRISPRRLRDPPPIFSPTSFM
jgi:hypothetical protein